jgi:hypothetical protein
MLRGRVRIVRGLRRVQTKRPVFLHVEFAIQQRIKLTSALGKAGNWPLPEACFFAGVMHARGYVVAVDVHGDPLTGVRA